MKDFGDGSRILVLLLKKKWATDARARATIKRTLKAFSPEFLNRIDDIIIFNALEKRHKKIIDLELKQTIQTFEKLNYNIQLTDDAKDFIARKRLGQRFRS